MDLEPCVGFFGRRYMQDKILGGENVEHRELVSNV